MVKSVSSVVRYELGTVLCHAVFSHLTAGGVLCYNYIVQRMQTMHDIVASTSSFEVSRNLPQLEQELAGHKIFASTSWFCSISESHLRQTHQLSFLTAAVNRWKVICKQNQVTCFDFLIQSLFRHCNSCYRPL
jgi:hypothetical protein